VLKKDQLRQDSFVIKPLGTAGIRVFRKLKVVLALLDRTLRLSMKQEQKNAKSLYRHKRKHHIPQNGSKRIAICGIYLHAGRN
jgi:hypothetical protein